MKSQTSLSALNIGQSAIIAIAVTLIMWRATVGRGRRHDDDRRPRAGQRVHDPALHPAQLPRRDLPRDQAGARRHGAPVRRCIEENAEIRDAPGAPPLAIARRARCASSTSTSATSPNRQILFDVSFAIPAGRTVAVVGPSGSGKSTLARLLYRFYDVGGGRITIDGQDIRDVQQTSAARGDRHRAAGHGAVQRHDRVQHRVRPARRDARRDRRGGAPRADPRLRRRPARGLRDARRRARPQALGRREAARRHRARDPQGAAHPDLRRGDERARLALREGDPGRAARDRARTTRR